MGAFLEKPKTDKETLGGEGAGLKYGGSAMQGWRKEMEDKHLAQTSIEELKNHAFFGVFDGHAGANASKFCSEHLVQFIVAAWGKENEDANKDRLRKALKDGFLNLDENMRKEFSSSNERGGGTTAITVMITPDHFVFANCGDSRGLLCRDGVLCFATTDHKPSNDGERMRIEKAGGSVMMQRVNGSLAVSRALGDFEFKGGDGRPEEQLVSPEPEITELPRDHEKDHYIFLACDGVYDVMTNEEIVKFINRRLKVESDLKKICSDLIDVCLHKNSRDNMSAILITFKAAPTVSEDAISKEKEFLLKVSELTEEKIKVLVGEATDPLDVEESEVMSRLPLMLEGELPDFDFAEVRQEISEKLANAKKEKFGDPATFDGSNDPSAESDFIRLGEATFKLSPVTDAMDFESPKSSDGERLSSTSSSSTQTDSSRSA